MAERLAWLEATCPERAPVERLPILEAAVEDPAHEVRQFAAAALPAARPVHAVRPALAFLIRDEDATTRHLAAIGLMELGAAEVDPEQEALIPEQPPAEDEIAPPPATLARMVIRASRDPALTYMATRALGVSEAPEARAWLEKAAGRLLGDPYARLEAAAALVRQGERRWLAPLRKALKSRKKDLRPVAAMLAGEAGAEELRPELEAMLADPKSAHAYTAAEALGLIGAEPSRAALKAAAERHPDETTRQAAQAALSGAHQTGNHRRDT